MSDGRDPARWGPEPPCLGCLSWKTERIPPSCFAGCRAWRLYEEDRIETGGEHRSAMTDKINEKETCILLDKDRDLVLLFAKQWHLDYHRLLHILEGRLPADPSLAEIMAQATNTPAAIWMQPGKGPSRLIALKLYGLKLERSKLDAPSPQRDTK